MAANMWENSLKNVESDNNKILYETLLSFFLQRNGTYVLNKPRILPVLDKIQYTKYPQTILSDCESYENLHN